MEHPIQYLEPVFKFLDHCVWEYGDYFFIALLYACMIFLAWFLVRPRSRNNSHFQIFIFPPMPRRRRNLDHGSEL